MKKLLLVFLALGSLITLTACPDNESASEAPAGGEAQTETTEGGSGH